MSDETNYCLAIDKSKALEETVAAILIVVIFGSKNLARQKPEKAIEKEESMP